jgi:hypothetical protein
VIDVTLSNMRSIVTVKINGKDDNSLLKIFTELVPVQSQASSSEICGGQNGTVVGFLRVLGVPCQLCFYQILNSLT